MLLQQCCIEHHCVCLCVLSKNVSRLEVELTNQKMGIFKSLYFSKFIIKELNTLSTIPLPSTESSTLGTDFDLQTIDNDIVSMEIFFKAWLHNSGTDQEYIHLLLPSRCLSNISRARDNSSTYLPKDILYRL